MCATRWLEAYQNGKPPKVKLKSTAETALNVIPLDFLKEHAVDWRGSVEQEGVLPPADGEGYPGATRSAEEGAGSKDVGEAQTTEAAPSTPALPVQLEKEQSRDEESEYIANVLPPMPTL